MATWVALYATFPHDFEGIQGFGDLPSTPVSEDWFCRRFCECGVAGSGGEISGLEHGWSIGDRDESLLIELCAFSI